MKWALQQLRIRTAEHLKSVLKDMKFVSGAEYVATKKQLGQSYYCTLLSQYAQARGYDPKWAFAQSKHY
jgi:hypothetical protein